MLMMRESKYKKALLAVFGVVLFLGIGITIPKLTVHDTIPVGVDRSCIDSALRLERLHPLQWLLYSTGAFQVTKADQQHGEARFYTLFRIPLGTTIATICDYAASPLSLPDLTLDGWYPHRESNISILFTRQEVLPDIGMTEGLAYGEQIHINSLPIQTTPEQWVADRQLETDLANKYQWDFVNGRRHLRVTHPTPAQDAQTDYFFGYGHVVISMFYPVSTLNLNPQQRTDYEVFLYNSVAPLVDTAYSRHVLRKNCAQDVPTASIDDSSADPKNQIVTFYWWDGVLQDNRKLDVLYEPETNFAGCSESVKSILEHVREVDVSNRENGFYRYTNTNLGFSIDQPAEVYFMGEKDGVVAFSLLSPNDLRQASSIGLVNALTITSAQVSPGEGTESKINGERVMISSVYGAYGGEQHWSYFFPDHNLLIQYVEKKPIYEQMIGTIRFE